MFFRGQVFLLLLFFGWLGVPLDVHSEETEVIDFDALCDQSASSEWDERADVNWVVDVYTSSAIEYCKQSYERKNRPRSAFQLGVSLVENGKGAEGEKYLKLAMGQKYAAAFLYMGIYMEVGRIKGTVDEAMLLFREARALGNIHASAKLGQFYANGYLGYKDHEKAMEYLQEAFWAGDALAAFLIADIKLLGPPEHYDPEGAVKILKQEQFSDGDGHRMLLYYAYLHGKGVEQDEAKALEIITNGAARGHALSIMTLIDYYRANNLEIEEKYFCKLSKETRLKYYSEFLVNCDG